MSAGADGRPEKVSKNCRNSSADLFRTLDTAAGLGYNELVRAASGRPGRKVPTRKGRLAHLFS